MISIEEFKKHLSAINYSDEQLTEIRDVLYVLSELLYSDFMKQKKLNPLKRSA